MHTSHVFAVVACLAGSSALPTSADTITVQQGLNGYAGTHDAEIYQGSPDLNAGSATTMQLRSTGSEGNASNPLNVLRESLVKWTGLESLSDLAGSTVTGVTVKVLRMGVPDYNGNTSYVRLYGIGESWDEAGVTWNSRDGVNDWHGAGVTGTTSRGAAVAQSVIADPNGTHQDANTPDNDDWWSFTLNATGVQLVQDWIDDPSNNHGLLFMLYADAGDYLRTSEATDPTHAPVLEITYVPVPEPATWGLLSVGTLALLGRYRSADSR